MRARKVVCRVLRSQPVSKSPTAACLAEGCSQGPSRLVRSPRLAHLYLFSSCVLWLLLQGIAGGSPGLSEVPWIGNSSAILGAPAGPCNGALGGGCWLPAPVTACQILRPPNERGHTGSLSRPWFSLLSGLWPPGKCILSRGW